MTVVARLATGAMQVGSWLIGCSVLVFIAAVCLWSTWAVVWMGAWGL